VKKGTVAVVRKKKTPKNKSAGRKLSVVRVASLPESDERKLKQLNKVGTRGEKKI